MVITPAVERRVESRNKMVERQLEYLAKRLSKSPNRPRLAWKRQVQLEKWQQWVVDSTRVAEAKLANLKNLGKVLANPGSAGKSSKTNPSGGSLSD